MVQIYSEAYPVVQFKSVTNTHESTIRMRFQLSITFDINDPFPDKRALELVLQASERFAEAKKEGTLELMDSFVKHFPCENTFIDDDEQPPKM